METKQIFPIERLNRHRSDIWTHQACPKVPSKKDVNIQVLWSVSHKFIILVMNLQRFASSNLKSLFFWCRSRRPEKRSNLILVIATYAHVSEKHFRVKFHLRHKVSDSLTECSLLKYPLCRDWREPDYETDHDWLYCSYVGFFLGNYLLEFDYTATRLATSRLVSV